MSQRGHSSYESEENCTGSILICRYKLFLLCTEVVGSIIWYDESFGHMTNLVSRHRSHDLWQ